MPTPPPAHDPRPTVVALVRVGDTDPGGRAQLAVAAGAGAVEVEAAGASPVAVADAVRAVRAAVTVPVEVSEADGPVLEAALDAGARGARVRTGSAPATLQQLAARGVRAVLVLEPDDTDAAIAARWATTNGLHTDRVAFDPGALDPSEPALLAARLRAIVAIGRAGRHAVASPEVSDRPGLAAVVALAAARGAASIRTGDAATAAHAAAVAVAIGGAR